ncbi:SUKH-4 family immunity protein [Streptomyces yerevanensis]|uniref:SUKH-4 family immunity protein n=1 Tax=Streptomyces yerevanensis TaxID=66378 RepID=UPI0005264109|nr:SUKH-4 family immunity protein [Streptomyces yerevanensis]
MGDVAWLPYDEHGLASSGVRGQAARLLVERGLPADCNRMFVRDRDRELAVRELPGGRAVFLGSFEDGINSYWLLTDNGEVWMVKGYEGDPEEQYGLVNTSVERLVEVLRIWETFVYSGKSDMDDDYDDWAHDVIGRARQADPMAFSDEDSWWSRVFEEVELGVLVPEDT